MRNLEDVGGSSVMYSSNFRIRETCSSCLKRIEKDIRSLSVSKNCREQLGSDSQSDSRGVKKGRGDARYIKSIYALLCRCIVWSLLCYCVRARDHCCVVCDATRALHAIHLVYRAPAKAGTNSRCLFY